MILRETKTEDEILETCLRERLITLFTILSKDQMEIFLPL
jgi:hypothetical protein